MYDLHGAQMARAQLTWGAVDGARMTACRRHGIITKVPYSPASQFVDNCKILRTTT